MHRTKGVSRPASWSILLGLILAAVGAVPGRAQEAPAPRPRTMGITVPINGTKTLQMTTKQRLKTVTNQNPDVARVSAMADDPTRVQITGLRTGVTRVTLVDVKDTQEVYDVVVQADVENLRAVLQRAVPTATIQLIPTNENTIVVSGSVARAEDVDIIVRTAQSVGGYQIINALRVGGVQQVQLCVVVAQVSRDQLRRMAFNFLTDSKNFFLGSTVGQAVAEPAGVGLGGAPPGGFSVNGQLGGIPGSPNGAPTNILFGVLNTSGGFLGFLQALKDESVVKLLAEPKLITMSGRPASFLSGGEQAIPVPAGLGQVGVQFEEFGTRLNFLPIVLGNGRIHLEVEPEVSSLNAAFGTSINGTVVPGRSTQRVHTTVELEDGQTFAIGGLIQRNVNAAISKVPVLGDIPFLGTAFSSKSFDETESELVILVTPRLIDAMSCDQLPKFLPGEETRSPDDFELFLEGILEAPRGPREVFPNKHYQAAYKNGPTAGVFPCAGGHGCGGAGCGGTGCGCGADPHPAVLRSEEAVPVTTMQRPVVPVSAGPAGATAPGPLPQNLPVTAGEAGKSQ